MLLLAMLLVPAVGTADCLVSGNVVGYVQLAFPVGGQTLIANPLNTANNTVGSLLPNVPDGTWLAKWAGGQWIANTYDFGAWGDPSMSLNPGEGAMINNTSGSVWNLTFVGEVLEGNLVNSIPAGSSVRASMVPQARPLGTSGEAGTLQFPAAPYDSVYLYDAYGGATGYYFDDLDLTWVPDDPVLGVAQSFFCTKAEPANWTRNFVVSCPTGPLLAIVLLGDGQVRITWSASGWSLQEATDPEGPWTSVAGNPTSPYVTQPVAAKKFFRLVQNEITSYSVTVSNCCTLIANQFNKPGGNTLRNVIPSLPCAARFMKWDNTNQVWLTNSYMPGCGWADSMMTLNPGEGAFLCPCCTNVFTITFSGSVPTPSLPVSMTAGYWYLLSRQYPGPGTFDNITGLAPGSNDVAVTYTPCLGYSAHVFDGFDWVWTPTDPTTAVGTAMWVHLGGGGGTTPPPAPEFPCPTNCLVTNVVLNTGFNQSAGTTYSIGADDQYWQVVVDPDGGQVPRPADVIERAPSGVWLLPMDDSQWISVYPSAADSAFSAYTFQSTFCLKPCYSNIVVSLCVRADDYADVYLNGHFAYSTLPWGATYHDGPAACTNLDWSLIAPWLHAGANSLQVVVTNSGGIWMGLNLTGSITGFGLCSNTPACCQTNLSIAGRKFNDLDGDGLWDSGEPAMAGWTIHLSNGQTAVTDSNGDYYFLNLLDGSYTVTEEVSPHWTQTHPAAGSYTVSIGNGYGTNQLDFGNTAKCCDNCTEPYPLSYQVALQANVEYSLVNHLCHGASNTLATVLPNPPGGTELRKYAGGAFISYTFDPDDLAWMPDGNASLNPGEGFTIKSPEATTLTFTGCEPTNCPLPCLPTNAWVLVGRLGIGTATWNDLSSCPPPCGTRVSRWNGTGYDDAYDYVNGSWTPQAPVLGVGESAFVCLLANTNCFTNCCDNCTEPYPLSYQVALQAGVWYSLVNHLCHGADNTLASVLPNPPAGTELRKWDGGWAGYMFDELDPVWLPHGNASLNPGEGFMIRSPEATTLTFTGCEPTNCPLPCLPTNAWVLVGRLGIGTATWNDLSSCPPPCGTRVSRWNGTGYDDAYDYVNGSWTPQAPVLGVGESAFVCLLANTNCCEDSFTLTCATNKTVPVGAQWSFDPPIVSDPCCGTNLSVIITTSTNSSGCSNLFTRIWNYTDCSNRTASCTQTVTVVGYSGQLSANMVGCVLISVPAGGSSLIADPFKNTTNTLATVLPNPPPGTVLSKWDGGWSFYTFDELDLVWLPHGNASLNPGEGGLLFNGDFHSPLNLTFVGEVMLGDLTRNIPAGTNVLSSMVPRARGLGTNGQAGTLEFPAAPGDSASLYSAGSWIEYQYQFDSTNLVWLPKPPFLEVAQAFWCEKAVAADWVQSVDVMMNPCGPRLAIAAGPATNSVTVTWDAPPEWELQCSSDPERGWTTWYGEASPSTFSLNPNEPRFFRLVNPALRCRYTETNTFLLSWRTPGYQLQQKRCSAPSWTDVPDAPVIVGDEYQVSLDDLSGWVVETCHHLYSSTVGDCTNAVRVYFGPCTNWFTTNSFPCANCVGHTNCPAAINVYAWSTNWWFHTTGYGWYLFKPTIPCSCCCEGCTEPYPLSYQVPLPAGVWYSLTNHLCHGATNTLATVLPNPPGGTELRKWDGGWDSYTFDELDLVWLPHGNASLNPGEGFMIKSPVATTLTFTGCEPNAVTFQATNEPTFYRLRSQ